MAARANKVALIGFVSYLSSFHDRLDGRPIHIFRILDGFWDADSSMNGLPTILKYHPIAVLGNLLKNAATAPSANGTWFLLKSSTQGL
jgi:hypothetical protein